jgi:hypothetical protein
VSTRLGAARALTWLTVVGLGLAGIFAGVACVDLFHSTDFPACDPNSSPNGCSDDGPPGTDGTQGIDFCAWDSATARAQAERACAWLGACAGPLDASRFGECVLRAQFAFDCAANPSYRPAGASKVFWQELAKAKDCKEVVTAAYGSSQPLACNLDVAGTYTGCTNGRAVECTGAPTPTAVNPCILTGHTCPKGAVATITSSCTGWTDTQNCQGDSLRCTGTRVVDCTTTNFDDGIDCALFNEGQSACDPAATACMPLGGDACTGSTLECSGDIVTLCVAGHSATLDCAAFGLTCKAAGAKPYDLLSACVAKTGTTPCVSDSCSGNTLKSCAHGVTVSVDCRTEGLGACHMASDGKAGACRAP